MTKYSYSGDNKHVRLEVAILDHSTIVSSIRTIVSNIRWCWYRDKKETIWTLIGIT